jgi:serine/threonine protein kinase
MTAPKPLNEEGFADDSPAHSDPPTTRLMPREDRIESLEGYELIWKLAAGGQATAYVARDRALDRLVVLKRYHGVTSIARRDAVLNEGRALARVRSPFVAPCYGVETRGDEIDLVVEYIPGRPLAELTADQRSDIANSARLVEQIAMGLAEVHACGLLHRDIKPRNIILGDDGVPRLVDFGLAVPLASDALHQFSGSPPFMAPEQARGQGERIDARTDVYGLGAVLYFLLTGQPPHDGETFDLALEQARQSPVIPPRRINPHVPRALERICSKAMASDPILRFPSADAFARALARFRFMRRAKPALHAVVFFLVLAVSASVYWMTSTPPRSVDRDGPSVNTVPASPVASAKQAAAALPRVVRFEIPHSPVDDQGHSDPERAGVLGRTSFTAREADDVTVRTELSEPAYSYIIAFRPDGTDELCDPVDQDAPPVRKQDPRYPPSVKSDDRYRLSEGAGLYAFAVVISRKPLPAYRQWKAQVGPMPWPVKPASEPGVVWLDDDQGVIPLLADDGNAARGTGAKARGTGSAPAKLASWLRSRPGIDVVTLEAFTVVPATKR